MKERSVKLSIGSQNMRLTVTLAEPGLLWHRATQPACVSYVNVLTRWFHTKSSMTTTFNRIIFTAIAVAGVAIQGRAQKVTAGHM